MILVTTFGYLEPAHLALHTVVVFTIFGDFFRSLFLLFFLLDVFRLHTFFLILPRYRSYQF